MTESRAVNVPTRFGAPCNGGSNLQLPVPEVMIDLGVRESVADDFTLPKPAQEKHTQLQQDSHAPGRWPWSFVCSLSCSEEGKGDGGTGWAGTPFAKRARR